MSPSPDFESGASTSSAIPAFLKKGQYSKVGLRVNIILGWGGGEQNEVSLKSKFFFTAKGERKGYFLEREMLGTLTPGPSPASGRGETRTNFKK
jgi:hypothetical protein